MGHKGSWHADRIFKVSYLAAAMELAILARHGGAWRQNFQGKGDCKKLDDGGDGGDGGDGDIW